MRWPALWSLSFVLAGMLGVARTQSADPKPSQTSQSEDSNSSVTSSKRDTAANEVQPDNARALDSGKRNWRLRLGGVSVGAGYSHYSGPIYPYSYPFPYAYQPYGFYPGDWVMASLWFPIWGPYPFYGPGSFSYNSGRGEVRLTTDPKDARVYIDGGYAGPADKLKNLWLDPGAYDLTVSAPGREDFHQRLYVLSGKSLKITAKLDAAAVKEKP